MRISALLFILILCGCSTGYQSDPWGKVVDSDEMTWIVQKVAAKWKHQDYRRIRLEHSHASYSDTFTQVHLEFSSQEILEVDQARNLLVDMTEDLLREINTNAIIADELSPYPFSADQLHIEINFETYIGEYVDPYYIGCVELKNGFAYYYAFDEKDQDWYNWHARVESYSKTREVSMLSRAAEKQFVDESPCSTPKHLEELFMPENLNGPGQCGWHWKF